MRFKKIILFLLTFSILCTTCQNVYATQSTPSTQETSADSSNTNDTPSTEPAAPSDNWPAAPEITAGSAILIDADTGTILYEKNSHIKGYPASITKLMTALLTVENCSLYETVTFSEAAAHSVTWEDSQIPIAAGEQYSVETALYALLLHSANDVAYGLAEHVAGSVPAFCEMMNARAAELGALNTHFNNASGLNDPEHYTSAYDIAMFSRACFNNPTIVGIMKTSQYEIPISNKYGYTRTINQRHEMLKNGKYYYQYAVGGKTGFTNESKYTLCTFATKGDLNLIAVVLLCEEIEDRYEDTIALFEYGFNNFEKLTLNSADAGSLLGGSNYYNSNIFSNSMVSFSLASTAVTVPIGVTGDEIDMVISRDTASGDTFANVRFKYGDVVVGNSELLVSTTKNTATSTRPSNLPFLPEAEAAPVETKDYIVINAMHIIYGVIIFLFLTIILLGLIFMNYSEYGKEVLKTRRRRRSYHRRKLRF